MICYPPVKQPVVWLCPPAHFLKKMPEAATVNLYIWKNQIVACSFDSSQLQFTEYIRILHKNKYIYFKKLKCWYFHHLLVNKSSSHRLTFFGGKSSIAVRSCHSQWTCTQTNKFKLSLMPWTVNCNWKRSYSAINPVVPKKTKQTPRVFCRQLWQISVFYNYNLSAPPGFSLCWLLVNIWAESTGRLRIYKP